MNRAQRNAVNQVIGNIEDDLYRAKMQKKADPNWKSGNGESIDDYISDCEKRLVELKEGL
jgi:hypothetical protein